MPELAVQKFEIDILDTGLQRRVPAKRAFLKNKEPHSLLGGAGNSGRYDLMIFLDIAAAMKLKNSDYHAYSFRFRAA